MDDPLDRNKDQSICGQAVDKESQQPFFEEDVYIQDFFIQKIATVFRLIVRESRSLWPLKGIDPM
jgi:hypothetical protein